MGGSFYAEDRNGLNNSVVVSPVKNRFLSPLKHDKKSRRVVSDEKEAFDSALFDHREPAVGEPAIEIEKVDEA